MVTINARGGKVWSCDLIQVLHCIAITTQKEKLLICMGKYRYANIFTMPNFQGILIITDELLVCIQAVHAHNWATTDKINMHNNNSVLLQAWGQRFNFEHDITLSWEDEWARHQNLQSLPWQRLPWHHQSSGPHLLSLILGSFWPSLMPHHTRLSSAGAHGRMRVHHRVMTWRLYKEYLTKI